MIDRSYLPFKSASEHQDRGMEKWLGFYLSEHTSSLNQDRQREDLISDLSQEEKFFLLGQLYSNGAPVKVTTKFGQTKQSFQGVVEELTPMTASLKTVDGYRLIEIEEILELALADEGVTPKSLDSIDL
ncbi:hypothetical protein [Streptococcus sobrinus]|uniref:hypothetical protein n=1 Tax=Streptococcus sobrinus TaxID=1310 RepID=UPI000D70875F|nr:hypothetical protein [Streptococcus sobrinus]AWN61643.1 hypothetical protein DLJ52_05265 [Streptococcus sobrinus]AWN63514.1 hypothetical protein DLJ51_05265 [Streptococcus sobrinus]SQG20033.1 Uncharacterised protein [Streptococcus sobrinus]